LWRGVSGVGLEDVEELLTYEYTSAVKPSECVGVIEELIIVRWGCVRLGNKTFI
jgi:hypothetical protein